MLIKIENKHSNAKEKDCILTTEAVPAPGKGSQDTLRDRRMEDKAILL